jgi:hypothetical protein
MSFRWDNCHPTGSYKITITNTATGQKVTDIQPAVLQRSGIVSGKNISTDWAPGTAVTVKVEIIALDGMTVLAYTPTVSTTVK